MASKKAARRKKSTRAEGLTPAKKRVTAAKGSASKKRATAKKRAVAKKRARASAPSPKRAPSERRQAPAATSRFAGDDPDDLGPEPNPPALPAPEVLPLNDPNFSWRRFEHFCRAFVSKLPGVVNCINYGKPGDKQFGIDLVATYEDGSKVTFQCRQWARFTAVNAAKAIKETTYAARAHVVLTSAEADRAARDEVDKHPDWELWDVLDISQRVRNLPPNASRGIVEVYFGTAWRRAFLGVSALAAFAPGRDALAALLDPARKFNHCHALAAQGGSLDRLVAFADGAARAMLVAGCGGSGKTRLILELDRRLGDTQRQLLWLQPGVPLNEATVDQIPLGSSFIFVDDAHRREDLPVLMAALRQRPALKIILGTRPHAAARLVNELRRANFADHEVGDSLALEPLTRDAIRSIVDAILGEHWRGSDVGARISRIADGSPLVATVAAALVRDKQLAPELLQEDAAFADAVFSKFEDALLGAVVEVSDQRPIARDLMPLVAALSPFPITDRRIVEVAAQHLSVPASTVMTTLGALETAGVLTRQGDSVRITPDVLSDHILARASLTPQGDATGFPRELVESFGPLRMGALLRNFAELDWRIRNTRPSPPSAVEDIWRHFEEGYSGGDEQAQRALLDVLADVAYFQPERSLAFLTARILSAAPNVPLDPDVEARCAVILSHAGYNMKHLPEVVALLLEVVSRAPTRVLDKGAMGALKQLATYETGKPADVAAIVVDEVERWRRESNGSLDVALQVTRPVLAKSGERTTSNGRQITFGTFAIRRDAVAAVRARVRALFAEALHSSTPRIVHFAIAALCEDVGEPLGGLGRPLPDAMRATWTVERMTSLACLEKAISSSSDPFAQLAVRAGLRWQALYGSPPELRLKAKQVIEAIPDEPDQRFARAIVGDVTDAAADDLAYQANLAAFQTMVTSAASEFLQAYPRPEEGSVRLEARLRRATEWQFPSASHFLEAIARLDPQYAAGLLREALLAESSLLAAYVPSLLQVALRALPAEAPALVSAALQGPSIVREGLARTLASYARANFAPALAVWRKLLDDDDPRVRRAALSPLRDLATYAPGEALELALSVRVDSNGQDGKLIDEVCSLLYGLTDEQIGDAAVAAMLEMFRKADSLEEHWIREFLTRLVRRRPLDTIDMLIVRVEADQSRNLEYRALPFEGLQSSLAALSGSPEYGPILAKVIALGAGAYRVRYHAAKLFRAVALLNIPLAMRSLDVLVLSGTPDRIEHAATLFAALPGGVKLGELPFISALLRAAHAAGPRTFASVESTLRLALTPLQWSSTVGEADPAHIAAGDRVKAISASLVEGSLERNLFEAIDRDITESISRRLAEDEAWVREQNA